jgi:phasin family protein
VHRTIHNLKRHHRANDPSNPSNHHETIMITNPTQFFELQRAQVNAFNSVGHALLAATEKLARLNAAASRSAFDTVTRAAQSVAGVTNPKELVALSGASAQPSIETLMNYTRELVGITNGVSAEIGKVVERQIADSNRRVAEMLDYAAKNAPAGSEQALALLRNAMAASSTAFDTVSKASRQASDWAEANLATAAKATSTALATGAEIAAKAHA